MAHTYTRRPTGSIWLQWVIAMYRSQWGSLVSEPDPRKIEKEGLAHQPAWKCTLQNVRNFINCRTNKLTTVWKEGRNPCNHLVYQPPIKSLCGQVNWSASTKVKYVNKLTTVHAPALLFLEIFGMWTTHIATCNRWPSYVFYSVCFQAVQ